MIKNKDMQAWVNPTQTHPKSVKIDQLYFDDFEDFLCILRAFEHFRILPIWDDIVFTLESPRPRIDVNGIYKPIFDQADVADKQVRWVKYTSHFTCAAPEGFRR